MTTATKRNKGGRPRREVATDDLGLITELASRGISELAIAKALGMSSPTFTKRKRESEAIQQALDLGRAVEHDSLVNVLFQAATVDKNLIACMFLLKTRHGYSEGHPLQGQGGGVTVNISLPGAYPTEKYIEVVNGTTEPFKLPKKSFRRPGSF